MFIQIKFLHPSLGGDSSYIVKMHLLAFRFSLFQNHWTKFTQTWHMVPLGEWNS